MEHSQGKLAITYDADNKCLAPLVHIGYAKAGSTSIQSVFGDPNSGFACDRALCLHKPGEVKNTRIVRYLAHTHDFEFDPEHLRFITMEELGWAQSAGRLPVISYELLAGSWLYGSHNCKLIADRIKSVWPEARILMIYREQKSMINSAYRHYIKKGGTRSFDQLLNPKGTGHTRGPGFSLRHFKYDQLLTYYHKIFGIDKVLALPLELLREDTSGFFGKIFEFAGVEPEHNYQLPMPHEKIGIDAYTARYKRYVNPILAKDYVNGYSVWCTPYTQALGWLFIKVVQILGTERKRTSAAMKLENEITRAVAGYYGESNRNLESLTNIKLDKYGYDLQKY